MIPLYFRIAGGQVPKPRCLSPAANSLDSSIAVGQVPRHLVAEVQLPMTWIPGLLVVECLTRGAQALLQIAWIPGLLVVGCLSLGA